MIVGIITALALAAQEAAFEGVRADPTSWGNLTNTPLLLWVMDSQERYKYYSTCP